MKNVRLKSWLFILLASGLLGACGSLTPERATLNPQPTATIPSLRWMDAPQTLCRDATQMRLQPVVEGEWPANAAAAWVVRPDDNPTVIASGMWTPQDRDLYIAFPNGEPLVPGDYQINVAMNGTTVLSHAFSVRGTGPQLRSFSAALTPTGTAITSLAELPHVIYLRYVYEGVCPGAPLWITVRHEGETICNRNTTVQAQSGEDATACYRDDGAPFEAGTYEATLTLIGSEEARSTFDLGAEPEPTKTPEPIYEPVCEPPFAAVGLTPDEKPHLPKERFEWYTQSVYVGAQCRGLPPRFFWVIRWYRDGEEVRVHRGRWTGGEAGLLWDTLTGTEASPFLPPGTYTTTLALADKSPLTVNFRVVAYQPQE